MTQPESPAAGGLGHADLVRITGADAVQVLRLRQRPGRSVLHVSLRDAQGQETGQGAIWCFAGDKAGRVVRRHPASAMDPVTNAVFDRFPADHRLPEIAAYLHWVTRQAPARQRAAGMPELLRYRPGLSCTFRVVQGDGQTVVTKIIAGQDVTKLARKGRAMAALAPASGVRFIRPLQVQPELRAITYALAPGRALDRRLREDTPEQAIAAFGKTLAALARFPAPRSAGPGHLTAEQLRESAAKSHAAIAARCPRAGSRARAILDGLGAPPPGRRAALVHGDMKIDHAFLEGPTVTFVDTEGMAIGDPRHDLACLEASLILAAIRGQVPEPVLAACRDLVRRAAGPGHDWFLGIARLGAARHFAQRPGDANLAAISRAMEL